MKAFRFFSSIKRWLSNRLFYKEYAYKYYNSKEDYYRSLLRDDNTSRLIALLTEHQQSHFNPEIQIKFRKIEFGTFVNQVIKKLGRPRFVVDNSQYVKGHKILYYRFKIDNIKTIAQLHFLNGYFFYAKYTFKSLNSSELKKVISILKSKYFYLTVFEDNLTRLKDKANNVISLEKSLYLNIKYISGNPDFVDFLNQLFVKQLEKRSERELNRVETLRDSL